MEIDHRGPVPPYRQIAAILAGRIRSGDLAAGEPIPSERTLMQETGVAWTTVRRAIRVLREEEGLVYTVPGRGTYVLSRDRWPTQT